MIFFIINLLNSRRISFFTNPIVILDLSFLGSDFFLFSVFKRTWKNSDVLVVVHNLLYYISRTLHKCLNPFAIKINTSDIFVSERLNNENFAWNSATHITSGRLISNIIVGTFRWEYYTIWMEESKMIITGFLKTICTKLVKIMVSCDCWSFYGNSSLPFRKHGKKTDWDFHFRVGKV